MSEENRAGTFLLEKQAEQLKSQLRFQAEILTKLGFDWQLPEHFQRMYDYHEDAMKVSDKDADSDPKTGFALTPEGDLLKISEGESTRLDVSRENRGSFLQLFELASNQADEKIAELRSKLTSQAATT